MAGTQFEETGEEEVNQAEQLLKQLRVARAEIQSLTRINQNLEEACKRAGERNVNAQQRAVEAQKRAKQAQQRAASLLEKDVELQGVLDAIFTNTAVIVYDLTGRPVKVNRAAIGWFGAGPNYLTTSEVFTKGTLASAENSYLEPEAYPHQRALRGEHIQGEQFVYHAPNGQQISVLVYANPLYTHQGELIGAISVWNDVRQMQESALKQAELLRENRRQRELLERLVNEAPVAVCLLQTPEFRHTLVNPAYRKMVNGSQSASGDSPLNRTVVEVWGDVSEDFHRWLEMVYETGTPYYGEEVPYARSGQAGKEEIYLNISFTPIKIEDEHVEDILVIAQDVSETVRARRQLQAEWDRLSTLIESISDEVWFCSREGNLELVNSAAAQNLGVEGKDLINPVKDALEQIEILNPNNEPRPIEDTPLLRSLKEGVLRGEEIVINHKSGERMFREFNSAPIKNETGEVLGSVAVVRDITERKKMEERLTYHALLLDHIHDAIIATDENFQVTAWNPAAEELYGWNADEAMGKNLVVLLHSHLDQEEREEMAQQIRKNIPLHSDMVQARRDGQRLLIDSTIISLLGHGGNLTGYLISNRDITKNKQAEDELRRSEERSRRLVEANIIGVLLANAFGEILDANEAFLKMVGYDNQDLEEGRLRWDAITPPECLSLDEMGIAEARQNGACTPYEKEYLHKNGSRIPILIGYAMLEGTVDEFICFVLDLTKQKQSEREAQRYATELERSNRDLEEFAFVASHDLQEPLRKVVRFGARLVERHAGGLDEQGLDYLLRMQAAAERMQHMIRDLLAYARVNSQGRPFEELDLNQLVQEVLSDLDARIQVSGGRIELGELHKLRADPLQMRLLFQNLISNALKFCRPEANPVVQVESRQLPEDILEIRVKDNGIGFDVQKLDFLMQPFQRLHTRNEYEGSGIGLAICRKVVERHGGQISAESTPGKGSTFIVRLPGNSPNPVGEG